jgi:hypothetical protein
MRDVGIHFTYGMERIVFFSTLTESNRIRIEIFSFVSVSNCFLGSHSKQNAILRENPTGASTNFRRATTF